MDSLWNAYVTWQGHTGYFFVGNETGRNAIIFGLDSDDKGKDILIVGKGSTQGLGGRLFLLKKFIRLILLNLIQHFV